MVEYIYCPVFADLVLANSFCSHHASLAFSISFLQFSFSSWESGPMIGIEMVATMVIIIISDNLKERNIDCDLLLKSYYVLRAFQVLLPRFMRTLQGCLHFMSKETKVQRIEATFPRIPNK